MKVSELIATLQQCDPDAVVVMSKDEEGNGFQRLGGVECSRRYRDGEIGLQELTESDAAAGFTEEDIMDDGEDCIVLWP